MTIRVLITRPAPQGADFAEALRARCGVPFDVILSPLMHIVPLVADLPPVQALIFTSANGVAQAARLGAFAGTTAYCVGPTTAAAAAEAGFAPVQGPGTAPELAQMILSDPPKGPLAHIRGRHAQGKVVDTLSAGGLTCFDIVAYDQRERWLTKAALQALGGDKPLVIPLFSPRTGTILSRNYAMTAPLHLVGISENALPAMQAVTTRIAPTPDLEGMLMATCDCIKALSAA